MLSAIHRVGILESAHGQWKMAAKLNTVYSWNGFCICNIQINSLFHSALPKCKLSSDVTGFIDGCALLYFMANTLKSKGITRNISAAKCLQDTRIMCFPNGSKWSIDSLEFL